MKRRWFGKGLELALGLRRQSPEAARRLSAAACEFGSPESLIVPGDVDAVPEEFRFEQPFVAEFHDVTTVGPAGLCLLRDGQRLLDVSLNDAAVFEVAVNRHWRHLLGLRRKPGQSVKEPVAVLLHAYAGNYYHWHIECLARLEGYRHYEAVTGRRFRLLVPRSPPPWMRETWEALGYGSHDTLSVEADLVHCDTVLICSSRRQDRAAAPAACNWLRSNIGGAAREGHNADSSPRRLYVSRRAARSRWVVNEKELVAALAPLGFEVVVPEQLPFLDQVMRFSNAHLVVSSFGSGLTNTLYAPECSIIEFGGRDYNPTLRYLAAACGHRYRCLPARDAGADVVVDIRQLLEAVNAEIIRLGRLAT